MERGKDFDMGREMTWRCDWCDTAKTEDPEAIKRRSADDDGWRSNTSPFYSMPFGWVEVEETIGHRDNLGNMHGPKHTMVLCDQCNAQRNTVLRKLVESRKPAS